MREKWSKRRKREEAQEEEERRGARGGREKRSKRRKREEEQKEEERRGQEGKESKLAGECEGAHKSFLLVAVRAYVCDACALPLLDMLAHIKQHDMLAHIKQHIAHTYSQSQHTYVSHLS